MYLSRSGVDVRPTDDLGVMAGVTAPAKPAPAAAPASDGEVPQAATPDKPAPAASAPAAEKPDAGGDKPAATKPGKGGKDGK